MYSLVARSVNDDENNRRPRDGFVSGKGFRQTIVSRAVLPTARQVQTRTITASLGCTMCHEREGKYFVPMVLFLISASRV